MTLVTCDHILLGCFHERRLSSERSTPNQYVGQQTSNEVLTICRNCLPPDRQDRDWIRARLSSTYTLCSICNKVWSVFELNEFLLIQSSKELTDHMWSSLALEPSSAICYAIRCTWEGLLSAQPSNSAFPSWSMDTRHVKTCPICHGPAGVGWIWTYSHYESTASLLV